MQRLRGIFFADPAIILATIFYGAISLVVSFFDATGTLQIRVARRWAKMLLAVSGARVRVEGLEYIDPGGSDTHSPTVPGFNTARMGYSFPPLVQA